MSSIQCFDPGPMFNRALGFRAHVSAAPLKPVNAYLVLEIAAMFPRSHERGPIEARRLRVNRNQMISFRAHMSAAPLKHSTWTCRECGNTCFRAHMSAAPLKPQSDCRNTQRQWCFRAHMSAAPLKRPAGQVQGGVRARFRAHMSAAPLKLIATHS